MEADMMAWISDIAAGAGFLLFIGGAFALADIAQAVLAAV
jgi:hypothetical protein